MFDLVIPYPSLQQYLRSSVPRKDATASGRGSSVPRRRGSRARAFTRLPLFFFVVANFLEISCKSITIVVSVPEYGTVDK